MNLDQQLQPPVRMEAALDVEALNCTVGVVSPDVDGVVNSAAVVAMVKGSIADTKLG